MDMNNGQPISATNPIPVTMVGGSIPDNTPVPTKIVSTTNPLDTLNRVISGVSTDGSPLTIVDSTKDFEADVLKDKVIRIIIGAITYYRKITASLGSTITFPAIVAAAAASAAIGEAPGGIATIRCKAVGDEGNQYSVEAVAGTPYVVF